MVRGRMWKLWKLSFFSLLNREESTDGGWIYSKFQLNLIHIETTNDDIVDCWISIAKIAIFVCGEWKLEFFPFLIAASSKKKVKFPIREFRLISPLSSWSWRTLHKSESTFIHTSGKKRSEYVKRKRNEFSSFFHNFTTLVEDRRRQKKILKLN